MAKKIKKEEMTRKDIIRENVAECIDELEKDVLRSFDMRRVVELPGTRGMLRNKLKDFKPEEKKLFREVLQDFKRGEFLIHKWQNTWCKSDKW